jgi:biofilm protein TabA
VALFVSEDGLSFPFEKARLAVDLIPAYYKSYDPSRVKIWWEPSLPNRLEAPRHYDIDGDKIYALVQHYETKPREKGKWEAHRLYLDVHYVAAGIETLGYAPVGNLTAIQAYEPADDYTLFRGHGDFVTASAGMFVVFFPEDAHMPCLACETPVPVRKVVVKVAVEAGR